jgi:hypothetical protein
MARGYELLREEEKMTGTELIFWREKNPPKTPRTATSMNILFVSAQQRNKQWLFR